MCLTTFSPRRLQRIVCAISILIAAITLFGAFQATFADDASAERIQKEKSQLHGVWVSTVSNIDFPKKPGQSADEFRTQAREWLDLFQELGFNAIFLQVRPMGDAFYPSELYPWSSFLTGEQGKAPDEDFDALRFWLDEAHARGIQLHAWINPYRVTVGRKTLDDLAPNNPARLHPEWTFQHKDRIYLNPGVPEARRLVVDGIVEIVKKYDVDGVHIDDYFYPERKVEADKESFQTYGQDFDNIEDWRRNNVNLFIKEAGEAIHHARPNAEVKRTEINAITIYTPTFEPGLKTNGSTRSFRKSIGKSVLKSQTMRFSRNGGPRSSPVRKSNCTLAWRRIDSIPRRKTKAGERPITLVDNLI